MAFQNIDLSHLTPYSAKFAGYKINSGKLSLTWVTRCKGAVAGQQPDHCRQTHPGRESGES